MGSKRAFYVEKLKRSVITDVNSKERKQWANAVSSAAAEAMNGGELITEPVRLTATFYFARPKAHYGSGKRADTLKPSAPQLHSQSPDLDKLLRNLNDALTGVVVRDDKQVCEIFTGRFWTTQSERVEVTIEQLATP